MSPHHTTTSPLIAEPIPSPVDALVARELPKLVALGVSLLLWVGLGALGRLLWGLLAA
ncbi:hypothetical protein [Salinispora vitiensis]|uniref:hypothetical protein n=1 Tax=Salinispora vitiensis TaxID=999544 RepID=UPI00036C689B|nr:hypothetical protein [Salinispora vitiensis]